MYKILESVTRYVEYRVEAKSWQEAKRLVEEGEQEDPGSDGDVLESEIVSVENLEAGVILYHRT